MNAVRVLRIENSPERKVWRFSKGPSQVFSRVRSAQAHEGTTRTGKRARNICPKCSWCSKKPNVIVVTQKRTGKGETFRVQETAQAGTHKP